MTQKRSNSELAPIALFVYRRTDLLREVLKSLQDCVGFSESSVFVFSDGPKKPETAGEVEEVRTILAEMRTPNMTIITSQTNKGLARSIIDGVSDLCAKYGRVIVLEDDLVLAPLTLKWFNDALEHYKETERVMQVSAFAFHSRRTARRGSGLFLPIPSSWGWATWSRAWQKFDPAAVGADEAMNIKSVRRSFDLHGAFKYSKMLKDQRRGLNDSWAIRWYWSMFINKGLTLYPPLSFVRNVGQDPKATHSGFLQKVRSLFVPNYVMADRIPDFPETASVDDGSYRSIRRVIRFRLF